MCDLFLDERTEKRFVSEVLLLGALDEIAPDTARIGEVEALEDDIEVCGLALGHRSPPRWRARTPPGVKRTSWPRACAPRSAPFGCVGCGARTRSSMCCSTSN